MSDSGGGRGGFLRGAHGLRPGWAIALFLFVSFTIGALLFTAAHLLARWTAADMTAMQTQLVPAIRAAQQLALSCGLMVGYLLVVRRFSSGGLEDYGLNPARAGVRLLQGAVVGALAMALLVGALVLTHSMTIGHSGSSVRALVLSGLQWAAVFVPGAFVEEMAFRGYPFFRIAQGGDATRAAIAMSLAFGAAHVPNGGEDVIGIIQVIITGLVFCLAVWRTGSLWWAIGAHAAWNWTQTFVFGCSNSGLAGSGSVLVTVPVGPAWLSGGATGPEGSVLGILAMGLIAGVILTTLPRQPPARKTAALPSGI